MKQTASGGDDAWDTNRYLNIWVCDFTSPVGNLDGYSSFPSEAGSGTDGIVITPEYFGTYPPGSNSQGSLGRTAVHEIGHWLNLLHPFHGAVDPSFCGDDLVPDVPNTITPSTGSGWGVPANSCDPSNKRMSMNYMDYMMDVAKIMFTDGQKLRAHALFSPGGVRALIVNQALNAANPPTIASLASLLPAVCQGTATAVTLTAALSPAVTDATYTLYAGTTNLGPALSSSAPSWSHTPLTTTTYQVYVTRPNGCTYTAQTQVQVTPPPVVTLTYSPSTFCAGDPVEVTATVFPGATYTLYDLTNSITYPQTSTPIWPVFPLGATTYQVVVQLDASSICSSTTANLTLQPQVVSSLPGGPYVVFNNSGQVLTGTGTPNNNPGLGTGIWTGPTGGFPIMPSGTIGGYAQLNPATGALPANIEPGTYSVCYTYTSPQGCVAPQVCTQLEVLPYACELKTGPKPDFTWEPDLGTTTKTLDADIIGHPYTFPAGVYHVTCPVALVHGDFISPPGTVFLFEAGTSLTLVDEGRLTAYKTRFTAACDQMWTGIQVKASSRGLYLGEDGYDLDSPLPSPEPYGTGPQHGEVSHAVSGVLWVDPSLTPVRLVSTHFFNNLIGLQAGTYPQNVDPYVHPQAGIVGCVFDTDPQFFKKTTPGGQLFADWLPLAHLALDGWSYADPTTSPMPLDGNLFSNALLGIVSAYNVDPFTLTLGRKNRFEENRVMGLAVPTLTQSLDLGGSTQFVLPAATAVAPPSARLRTELEAAMHTNGAWLPASQTTAWGAWIGDAINGPPALAPVTTVSGASFEAAPGTPAFGNGSYPRIGLEIERVGQAYRIENCSFTKLRIGLRLGLEFPGENSVVAGSEFINCRQGIAVRNTYPATTPAFPAPIFWPRCNTFSRSNVSGNNWGIIIEPSTYVGAPLPKFDSYDARNLAMMDNTVAMKNIFLGSAPQGSFYLFLANLTTGTALYTAYLTKTNCLSCTVQLQGDFLSQNISNFLVIPEQGPAAITAYDPTVHSCSNEPQSFNTGFQRLGSGIKVVPATATAYIAQSYPNPTTNEAEISYSIPHTQSAELVIRELMRGSIVRKHPVNVHDQRIVVSVSDLEAGVYTYSIVADGVIIGTRKLVVSR